MVNTYYPGATSAAAGAQSVTLGVAGGANAAIAVGDLLLVIQMQDAVINSTNTNAYGSGNAAATVASGYTSIGSAGLYEFVRATSAVPVSGGTLSFTGAGASNGLVNSYNNAAATGTAGQKRFQVVTVPQYVNLTLSTTITTTPWDGSKGGVAIIDVAGLLTLSGGGLNADGAGFRGGGGVSSASGAGTSTDYVSPAITNAAHASKGEGVAGTPYYTNSAGSLTTASVEGYPGGSRARGAPANAGGGGTDGNPSSNDQNTGGGGGGNGGAGGLGGYAWCNGTGTGCPQGGGQPGARIAELGVSRVTMGGGGGAGTTNNATGAPGTGFASSGAAGGGIVIVRAGSIGGSGTFSANGASANNTVLNDGSGGGGAGGAILLSAVRTVGGFSITATANGGDGGTNNPQGSGSHGPGGGGGGGYIATTMSAFAAAAGGSNGTTQASSTYGTSYGAAGGTAASGTTISGASIPGLSSGGECTPTVTKSFASASTTVGTPDVMSIVVTNNNPTTALTALAFTDTYPANLVNYSTPAPAKSCATAATLAAAAAGSTFAVSAGTINAASSCTYSVTTTATATGSLTNTIASGGVTGTYGTVNVSSRAPATATVTVSAPLTLAKASTVYSDPVNGTTLPKAVPGAVMTYTLTITNPGSTLADSNSVVLSDPTAANLSLIVGDYAAAGSGPVGFTDGAPASALTYTFSGLGNAADDVDFSNDGGTTWTYTPTAGAGQADGAVRSIRIRPKGAMAAGSSFTVSFRYIVL